MKKYDWKNEYNPIRIQSMTNTITMDTEACVEQAKRIIDSLKEKQYIRRVDGKRYGKWDVLV